MVVKNILFVIGVAYISSTYALTPAENTTLNLARLTASELANTLNLERKRQVETLGHADTIYLCSNYATIVANDISNSTKTIVRRVSLTPRNMGSATTNNWEFLGLQALNERKSNGKPKIFEYYTNIKKNNTNYFSYIKPLFAEEACLDCHGSAIRMKPESIGEINEKYPYDKATNFEVGDLIGGVSVQIETN